MDSSYTKHMTTRANTETNRFATIGLTDGRWVLRMECDESTYTMTSGAEAADRIAAVFGAIAWVAGEVGVARAAERIIDVDFVALAWLVEQGLAQPASDAYAGLFA